MSYNQQQLPQSQLSNLAEQAIHALSLLGPEDQKKVLDYINAIVDDENEQGDN